MPSSKVAERLLVHARLCRQMAAASLDESVAADLRQLADESAAAATPQAPAERKNAVAIVPF